MHRWIVGTLCVTACASATSRGGPDGGDRGDTPADAEVGRDGAGPTCTPEVVGRLDEWPDGSGLSGTPRVSITTSATGGLLLAYPRTVTTPFLRVAERAGAAWTMNDVAHPEVLDPRVLDPGDGQPLVWLLGPRFVARAGGVWSAPALVPGVVATIDLASASDAVATADGVHAAWVDRGALSYAHRSPGGPWRIEPIASLEGATVTDVRIIADGKGGAWVFTSRAVAPDRARQFHVYSRTAEFGWLAERLTQLEPHGMTLAAAAIAGDGSHLAVVQNDGPPWLHLARGALTGEWTIEAVTGDDVVAVGSASFALAPDHSPRVAYVREATPGSFALSLARRAPSGWVRETVMPLTNLAGTALAIGPDGTVAIAAHGRGIIAEDYRSEWIALATRCGP